MALRQPRDSSGDLRQDLKQIAIDRIGQDEYDNLDTISKQKIDEFTNEQAIATQAFLQRQELNITDMEAVKKELVGDRLDSLSIFFVKDGVPNKEQ